MVSWVSLYGDLDEPLVVDTTQSNLMILNKRTTMTFSKRMIIWTNTDDK